VPTPYPPRPPYPPPGGDPGESDDALAAGVRGGTDGEVAEATALLTARHWKPAHDYAVICLAGSGQVASMATGTAFHQVFDRLRLGESGTDLRPRLLLAVRETVRVWASAERVTAVLPELRKPAGARGMRTAKGMVAENRILAEHAYHALPAIERCLLWHAEVEAEPLSVPAALLGIDTSAAAAGLEDARDKLREGVVRAHRELAPTKECRFYNRLLDVPLKRGGDLLPDVRTHLDACRYCRAAAQQLGLFDGRLGVMLTEAVLGWGARRYFESRPDRVRREPVRLVGAGPWGEGRGKLLDRIPAPGRRRDGESKGRGRFGGKRGAEGGPAEEGSGAGRGAFGMPGRRDEGGSAGGAGTFGGSGRRGEEGVSGADAGFGAVGRPVAGAAWGEGSMAGEAGRTGGDSAGAFAAGAFPDPDALPLDASPGAPLGEPSSYGPASGEPVPDGDRPRSRRAAGRAKLRGSRGARGARRAVRRMGKGRPPRALIAGVGVASAGVLTTFLASGMWTDGGSDPAASTSVSGGGAFPGTDSPAPAPSPSAQGSVDLPGGTHQTRLRNADADLCLELPAGARAGTALVLEVCSSNWSQQWSYEDDGLLRNVAEPDLCVDSRADAGVVIANVCAGADSPRADDVRYDLTVQGELLPRWDDRLPLAAVGEEPGANVAVKVRDGSAAQRWLTDAPRTTPTPLG